LTFTKNIVNVGLSGSRGVRYNVIKTAVDSITDASENNTYTVRVYPGIYIEDTITVPSWVAVKGDSSISTIVSASNPSASIFVMSDQSMVIDMQIQGSTAPNVSAIYYSSPTTPQRNAIAYAENIRFGTNYTNATCAGSGSGNCILQCSNVKYGGYTDAVSQKSFDIGFRVTGSGGSIGRMQLRNVTSTNGGVAGTDNNQIFALADAPGCTFIVNGCLLTRATGTARGTGFKVYNGGSLRLTGVNFQRWINGIWAPQTGSAPSIDAVALNFENCTYDVLIEHTGSTGKVSGTDTFLKTIIPATASLYEVGQDPRRLTVAKKGGDFSSISASVAWITDSSETNRYVIDVGPGQFTEGTIDLSNKPYVSIVGSNIQTTEIFPSSSTQHIIKLGKNNEISFLSLANAGSGYAGLYVDDIGDFGQAHKISFYDCDTNVFVISRTQDTQFYGEYLDYNGIYTYGTRVSASNDFAAYANIENYYQFPSSSIATIGNLVEGFGADLNLAVATFDGSGISVAGGTAIQVQSSASCDITSADINNWDYGFRAPNVGGGPQFNINGTVFRDNTTYDFYIQNAATNGRFQGSGDNSKISNASTNFYWSFMDITDGEFDITEKLSVTFSDGTHTDATTLIFNGSPMGVMSGGQITLSSGLTITTAAGYGYCEDPLDTGIYKRIDWANSNITLTANSNNYIYINYNGVLSASGTAPSSLTNIILGRVVTNNTTVQFIDQTPYDSAHMANKISKFNRDALGPVYAEGSTVTENVTPFRIDVTAGSYFFSENNFTPSGGTAITLGQYYPSASTWNTSSITTVPSGKYVSGSTLIAMSASYYTKHTLYGVGDGADEKYFLVLNSSQYSTLVETENADLPTPPTYFSDGVVSLASIYVQSGSANITQIQDIRPIIGFRAAGVNASSVHGNLLGLSADDHTQYLLVNGGRQMSGDLGLGGNDLYNFASVSGSSITASGATITSITATSVNATSLTGSLLGNASTAISASYVTSSLVYGPNGFNTILSASYSLSASFAISSSRSVTSSFAFTSSYITGSSFSSTNQALSASYAISSSFVTGSIFSGANRVLSSSYALTASYALNGGGSSTITIGDEGTSQGTATFLNFTGSGVTATVSNSTASIYIPGGGSGGGLTTKAGSVANSSFTGNPKKATVTFSTAFSNTNYAITVTGEDARSWTIESKVAGSFVINANSNTGLSGTTYWIATAYGETT
jgi:hypothetical protein